MYSSFLQANAHTHVIMLSKLSFNYSIYLFRLLKITIYYQILIILMTTSFPRKIQVIHVAIVGTPHHK